MKLVLITALLLLASCSSFSTAGSRCREIAATGISTGSMDSCIKCVRQLGVNADADAIQGCSLGLDATTLLNMNGA